MYWTKKQAVVVSPLGSPVTIPAWISALTSFLVLVSCHPGSDNQPGPQAESVQIETQTYPIQAIGNQVWTTLNYHGPGGMAYGTGHEKAEYGRYYTFEEVKAIPLPAGWRIPTRQDYITLALGQGIAFENHRATRQQAIKRLLSTTHWRSLGGSNLSGFNAYPTGYCFRDAQPQDGDLAEFWLADGQTISIQEIVGQTHNLSFYGDSHQPIYRFTLRFVRDQ